MDRIREIVYETRRTGNTSWILQSAIRNPNCIIVGKDLKQAHHLREEFIRMMIKSPWYKKLWWKIFGYKEPLFVPISYTFRGENIPIIFDNGTFV